MEGGYHLPVTKSRTQISLPFAESSMTGYSNKSNITIKAVLVFLCTWKKVEFGSWNEKMQRSDVHASRYMEVRSVKRQMVFQLLKACASWWRCPRVEKRGWPPRPGGTARGVEEQGAILGGAGDRRRGEELVWRERWCLEGGWRATVSGRRRWGRCCGDGGTEHGPRKVYRLRREETFHTM
jgi:hypothetical protein